MDEMLAAGKEDNSDEETAKLLFDDSNLPSEEQLLVYEAFRRRIVDEDNLINNRTIWQLGSQTLLMAIWGALLSASAADQFLSGVPGILRAALMAMLCAVGLVLALIGFRTVGAAHAEIEQAKRSYEARYPSLYKATGIPKMTGDTESHTTGHYVPYLVPSVLAVIQLVLFWASIYAGTVLH